MTCRIYLVFDRDGFCRLGRRDIPIPRMSERVVEVNITIPNHVFDAPPIVKADLNIPEGALVYPKPEALVELQWPNGEAAPEPMPEEVPADR